MENLLVNLDDLAALAGQGARLEVRVHGGSMRPWIYAGDVARLEGLPSAPVRRGDVVLAQETPGRLTLHRVVEIRLSEAAGLEYRLQGDADRRSEGVWVGQDALLARLTGIRREGRFWSTQTPLYRAAVSVWLGCRRVWGL